MAVNEITPKPKTLRRKTPCTQCPVCKCHDAMFYAAIPNEEIESYAICLACGNTGNFEEGWRRSEKNGRDYKFYTVEWKNKKAIVR